MIDAVPSSLMACIVFSFSLMGTTLELLQCKAKNGISDKEFEELLQIFKKSLPKNNELPHNTYEAKNIVCSLGLEVENIYACINDCTKQPHI